MDEDGINDQHVLGLVECSHNTTDECFCNVHRRTPLCNAKVAKQINLMCTLTSHIESCSKASAQ